MATTGALYGKVKPIQTDFSAPSEKLLSWAMKKSAQEDKEARLQAERARKKRQKYVENFSDYMEKMNPEEAEGRWDQELNRIYDRLYNDYANVAQEISSMEAKGQIGSDRYLDLKQKAQKIRRIPKQIKDASESVFDFHQDVYKGIKKGDYSKFQNEEEMDKLTRALKESGWNLELTDDYGVNVKWKEDGEVRSENVYKFANKPFGVGKGDINRKGNVDGMLESITNSVNKAKKEENVTETVTVNKSDGTKQTRRITVTDFSQDARKKAGELMDFYIAANPNAVREYAATRFGEEAIKDQESYQKKWKQKAIKEIKAYGYDELNIQTGTDTKGKTEPTDENKIKPFNGASLNVKVNGIVRDDVWQYEGNEILKAESKKKLQLPKLNAYAFNGKDMRLERKQIGLNEMMLLKSPVGGNIKIKKEDGDDANIQYMLGRFSNVQNMTIEDIEPQSAYQMPIWRGDDNLVVIWDKGKDSNKPPNRTFIRNGSRVPERLINGKVNKIYNVGDKEAEDNDLGELIKKGKLVGNKQRNKFVTPNVKAEKVIGASAEVAGGNINIAIPYEEFKENWQGSRGWEAIEAWNNSVEDKPIYEYLDEKGNWNVEGFTLSDKKPPISSPTSEGYGGSVNYEDLIKEE